MKLCTKNTLMLLVVAAVLCLSLACASGGIDTDAVNAKREVAGFTFRRPHVGDNYRYLSERRQLKDDNKTLALSSSVYTENTTLAQSVPAMYAYSAAVPAPYIEVRGTDSNVLTNNIFYDNLGKVLVSDNQLYYVSIDQSSRSGSMTPVIGGEGQNYSYKERSLLFESQTGVLVGLMEIEADYRVAGVEKVDLVSSSLNSALRIEQTIISVFTDNFSKGVQKVTSTGNAWYDLKEGFLVKEENLEILEVDNPAFKSRTRVNLLLQTVTLATSTPASKAQFEYEREFLPYLRTQKQALGYLP